MEEAHVHDLSGYFPVLNLGSVVLPIYFLVSSLAFVLGLLFLVRRAKSCRLSRNRALDTALVLMTTGFVGSRLFHVFFEEPAYYFEAPSRILEIWRGGFIWYGGAVIGAICSIAFLKWKREPIPRYLDLFAPVGALGYAIGRFACFLTGCCYGDICFIPGATPHDDLRFRYPTQIFAIVYEALVLVTLLYLEKHRGNSRWLGRAGQIFIVWLILHGAGRILMELFRGDPRGEFIFGFSISTWISGVLIA
ncbi:MAG: prolipoprotein diacylglyceryl transferase family protein, partial [Bdellovibrionota bacterium]